MYVVRNYNKATRAISGVVKGYGLDRHLLPHRDAAIHVVLGG